MKRRIPLGIVLTLLIVSVGITFAVTTVVVNRKYNNVITDFSKRSQQYEYLADVDEIVRNNYYGEIDEDSINLNLASGYIEGLADGKSMLMSADEYSAFERYSSGSMTGTGISAYFDEENTALHVTSVDPDSSAASTDLAEGCLILSVNGKEVTAENASSLINILSSTADGDVKISYVFGNTDENVKQLSLKCAYTVKAVSSKIVNNKYGYIRISDFYDTTKDEFSNALGEMSDKSVTKILLDLRNNSGNDFAKAAEIIDMLVPVASQGNKAIAIEKNRNGESVNIYSSDSESMAFSFAILVNDRTSGAAELLALDLRQFGKAELFGEQTAGNGKVMSAFTLDDGNVVYLATGIIIPYIGESFDGVGVTPDNQISMTNSEKNDFDSIATTDNDAIFKAACEYFG